MLQSLNTRPSPIAANAAALAPFMPDVRNIDTVASPTLLVCEDRVVENLRRTVAAAGGAARLRPHIKTHKCAEVLRLQMDSGISKFKCATIAEAEMAAAAGAPDILLAYQPVGPNIPRLLHLIEHFPATRFSCLVDNPATVLDLAHAAAAAQKRVPVFIDIDCGQKRTGIPPGPDAANLWALIRAQPSLEAAGLHAYDGHIHKLDPAERYAQCDASFAPIDALRRELSVVSPLPPGELRVREPSAVVSPLPPGEGRVREPLIVAGGTPTFPFHAARENVECSPGTNVFWDAGYAENFPDQDYLFAVWVLARVVSKPGPDQLCLDLGHKSIASESPHPRVIFPALPDAKPLMHNEEHLVLQTSHAAQYPIGAPLYGLPWHVCPTVALHQELVVVRDGMAAGAWRVAARDRRITI